MGHCCWMSVRFPCRSVNVWTRAWPWPSTTSYCLQDGAYWETNKPTALVRLVVVVVGLLTVTCNLKNVQESDSMSLHWWRNTLTNYKCTAHNDTHSTSVCVFVYVPHTFRSADQISMKLEGLITLCVMLWHFQSSAAITGQSSGTLLVIGSGECLLAHNVQSTVSTFCVCMCVLCSVCVQLLISGRDSRLTSTVIDDSGSWFICRTLEHRHHRHYGDKVELNTLHSVVVKVP